MSLQATNTKILTEYLDKKEFSYSIDTNPTPEKINRIKNAIDRKDNLMNIAVSMYKQVLGR